MKETERWEILSLVLLAAGTAIAKYLAGRTKA